MVRKPTTSEQTEYNIKKQVRKILIDTGWKFWMPSANAFGRGGQSDFLAVKRLGRFMAIETKYKDVPTQLQLDFLRMIFNAGHNAFLVDETNIDIFCDVLTSDRFHPDLIKYLMKWATQNVAEKLDTLPIV